MKYKLRRTVSPKLRAVRAGEIAKAIGKPHIYLHSEGDRWNVSVRAPTDFDLYLSALRWTDRHPPKNF